MKLSREFYSRDTKKVAKELLGKVLIHETKEGTLKGKIVETEAYYGKGEDPASRAHKGKSNFCMPMFEEVGKAFVYMVHNNWLLNIVSHSKGKVGAVLIRALEPLEGIELMEKRRSVNNIRNLCRGPGRLTKALGINRSYNGVDLTGNDLFLEDSNEKFVIIKTKRIGISKGKSKLLRFYIKDNTFVSSGR